MHDNNYNTSAVENQKWNAEETNIYAALWMNWKLKSLIWVRHKLKGFNSNDITLMQYITG